ncbi:MAG: Protein of unknown function DUF1553/DUF1549/Planctomycete cytC [Verrucomicrobia bacterium]|nr:MAG: Protein of unknown function DUF1553/DUF1549/Planctomycete cytC [Verrucomicrobiota bacterium]
MVVPADAAGPGPLQFNRDIRPIISEKCFQCHGPDPKKRDSGLRLDMGEAATADRKGVRAIVPGNPTSSEIIARVTSDDPDEVMPPPSAKIGTLSPQEVATLSRWISEGAPYEKHWAFNSLEPPKATHFDDLVARNLAARGVSLQPPADPATLIRRISFDLTGLPPTEAEVTAFLNDPSPDACERLIDRLLKSPRFGERMAVDWLDIARYADSYGFQVDRDRAVWPWRDWVIKAFNENLPFDQFITWQLSGDLLPQATEDQILATAFNRLHQQESEGGSVEEEYRVEYVADRIQTFSTAFLGLTFECARCHDHKFDPLTQKEYFQFFSMFQNIDEAGLYSFFTDSVPTPAQPLMDGSTKSRLATLTLKVSHEETKLAGLKPVAPSGPVTPQGELGRFHFDLLQQDALANDIDPTKPAKLKGENKLIPGRRGQAVRFTGDDAVDLPLGNFHSYEPFSISLWLQSPDRKERAVVFHRSRAWTDAGSRGYELLIEEGKLKWSLIHFWPGNAASVRTQAKLKPNTWTHVVVTNDGSGRASGLRLYVDGQPAATEVIQDSLTRDITGGGGDHIALGERFRDRGFKGGVIDEFRVYGRELGAAEARGAMDPGGANPLPEAPEYSAQLEVLKQARAELVNTRTALKEIMVMRELPQPKKAYVLFRGAYDQRRDEVGPGTPEILTPFPKNAPKNRLGLALWLTEPQHPLTARVTVNRFWQSLFGQGLVKTSEDFGSQSALPVYPEVLDWLSWRFIESGWNTKALLKTILMSRTYQQRSVASPALMADDPDNELLARGPRFRLPAEMIRDNALAAAGLLADRLGGPPVNPYEMSEAFKPVNPDGGDTVYRRSLYTTWRRTSPPPAMVTFDAPRRGICVAKRERTNSPLQALILLNGEQYVEAARVLGEKLHQESGGDPAQMIRSGFLRCLSRPPDSREIEICSRLYAEQVSHFTQSTSEAEALLKIGRAPRDPKIPLPQAAAATALAQALMNHDFSVVKR